MDTDNINSLADRVKRAMERYAENSGKTRETQIPEPVGKWLESRGIDTNTLLRLEPLLRKYDGLSEEEKARFEELKDFEPNPGKATLTQIGETGDDNNYPIYQEDVDMIKKSGPLAKRLTELQKTKPQPEVKKPLSEMTAQEKINYWNTKEEKDQQVLRTLSDTIDEVYNVKPEELNMGPDTTENIHEISEEDMMNLEAGWHRLPGKVKQAMLKSPEIEDEEIPDIMWYFDPKSQTFKPAETSNKNVSEVKDEDRKDPGEYYKYSSILKRMDDTHTRKNSDYGDAAHQGYKELGDVYYIVQLHNKLTRLKSLTVNNRTQQVKDESIDDTLLDLANYAIMFLESRHRND
jgi:hypothetical protein